MEGQEKEKTAEIEASVKAILLLGIYNNLANIMIHKSSMANRSPVWSLRQL